MEKTLPTRTVEYPGEIETDYTLPRDGVFLKPDSLEFSPPLTVELPERKLEVEGKTVLLKDLVTASATLTNPTSKPVQVDFWLGTLHLDLIEDASIRIKPPDPNGPPRPPPAPPPPFRISIPAHTRVKFQDQVYLGDYVYEGSPKAQIKWSMLFAKHPHPTGTFSIKLPYRSPSRR